LFWSERRSEAPSSLLEFQLAACGAMTRAEGFCADRPQWSAGRGRQSEFKVLNKVLIKAAILSLLFALNLCYKYRYE
jgi:hypothetical protein